MQLRVNTRYVATSYRRRTRTSRLSPNYDEKNEKTRVAVDSMSHVDIVGFRLPTHSQVLKRDNIRNLTLVVIHPD